MKLPFEVDFQNKVAVVTGGGGLICGEMAKAIAKCGSKVAVLSRTIESANKTVEAILNDGGIAKAYACNVVKKDELQKVHDEIVKDFGLCDILINGAGGNNPTATTDNEYHEFNLPEGTKTFFDLSQDGIESVFNLNFLGTVLPTQVFANDMIGRKGCTVLNVSSMNAYNPLTKIPAYSGAKAAVSNLTKWLAVHFSHVGIRVNAIAPGFFATTQNKALLWNEDGSPTARTKKILNATPIGRFGELSDLVGATLFLLSEEAAGFITGVVLPVDGGFLSYSGV